MRIKVHDDYGLRIKGDFVEFVYGYFECDFCHNIVLIGRVLTTGYPPQIFVCQECQLEHKDRIEEITRGRE